MELIIYGSWKYENLESKIHFSRYKEFHSEMRKFNRWPPTFQWIHSWFQFLDRDLPKTVVFRLRFKPFRHPTAPGPCNTLYHHGPRIYWCSQPQSTGCDEFAISLHIICEIFPIGAISAIKTIYSSLKFPNKIHDFISLSSDRSVSSQKRPIRTTQWIHNMSK